MSVLVSTTHLRSFLAVVETQSVTCAARVCGYSQPAVSGHIKAIEKELGVNLFHRDRAGMQLTSAGKQFIAGANRALSQLGELERALSALCKSA